MKKTLMMIIALILLIAVTPVTAIASNKEVKFRKAPEYIGLYCNKDFSEYIVVKNASKNSIVWSSTNKKVAAVSKNGIVTGLKLGSTYIVASLNDGNTVKYKIRVSPMIYAGGCPFLNFDKTELELKEHSKCKLRAIVSQFSELKGFNIQKPAKNLTWISSNSKVAKVSKSGKVTAVKSGKVTITAIGYGDIAKCTVIVK